MTDPWSIGSLQHGGGLLVILGAGASFDSLPRGHHVAGITPPLTKDLLWGSPDLISRYWQAQPLIADLRIGLRRPGSTASGDSLTFENALGEYVARAEFDAEVRSQVMAMRFYLRDLLWDATHAVMGETGGITNYTVLVTTCVQWAKRTDSHVCFVSFNYDPLLDYACRAHGRPSVDVFNPYVGGPHASLLKPHGSILWAWAHPGFRGARILNNATALAISKGEPEMIGRPRLYQNMGRSDVVTVNPAPPMVKPAVPAIALPLADKSDLIWPPDQEAFLSSELPNGAFGRVLTIGWRAAEPHFTSLLDRLIVQRARYAFVSGSSDDIRETTLNLNKPTRQFGPIEQDDRGFRHFVEESGLFDWLLSP